MGTSSVVCRFRPVVILSGIYCAGKTMVRQNHALDKPWLGQTVARTNRGSDKPWVGRYNVPEVGRISSVSTVARESSVIAQTTASATVFGDIILPRGASGHSVFQMSVSVAPGSSPMTLIPFGRNFSRRVFVKPSATCFDAL